MLGRAQHTLFNFPTLKKYSANQRLAGIYAGAVELLLGQSSIISALIEAKKIWKKYLILCGILAIVQGKESFLSNKSIWRLLKQILISKSGTVASKNPMHSLFISSSAPNIL